MAPRMAGSSASQACVSSGASGTRKTAAVPPRRTTSSEKRWTSEAARPRRGQSTTEPDGPPGTEGGAPFKLRSCMYAEKMPLCRSILSLRPSLPPASAMATGKADSLAIFTTLSPNESVGCSCEPRYF
eukprot:scaffold361_cov248-Pinguiococcus_pyrenoidosus.AAC.11